VPASSTALNVRGGLPGVLADAGFQAVTVRDRIRTPTGTYEIFTARHGTDEHLSARPVLE
jgi:hypothetical protein